MYYKVKVYKCCLCSDSFRSKETTLKSLSVVSARCLWAEKTNLMVDKHRLLDLFLDKNFLLCYNCSNRSKCCALRHSLNVLRDMVKPRKDYSWRRPMYDEDALTDLSNPAKAGFYTYEALWIAIWGYTKSISSRLL